MGAESHGSLIVKTAGPPKETTTAVPGFLIADIGFHLEHVPGKREEGMRNLTVVCLISFAMSLPLSAFAIGTCDLCGGEKAFNLIAGDGGGEGMVVGSVTVGNCASQVCVEYTLNDEAIAGGWLITETHVEVARANSGADIPQTKKNNPIPGQFEDVQYFEPGVEIYSYCVAFEDIAPGFTTEDNVDVAAHAVVARPAPDGGWTTVWQIGDVEMPFEGLLTNYADEFNWGEPAGPTTMGLSLAESTPGYANPFIVGVSENSEFPYNSNVVKNYATDFDVEWTGALGWGGRLTLSWSPGQSASEAKEITVSGDGLPSSTFTAVGTSESGAGWFQDKYPLVENSMDVGRLDQGTHSINFLQKTGDGTFWDWVKLEQPGLETETAWAEGCDFTGRNWATYICGSIVEECCDPCTAPYNPVAVVSSKQGLRKDNAIVGPGRSVPEAALVYDATGTENDFFSLGKEGWIVLSFPCQIVDGAGADIRVVEDTWGTNYPSETAEVFAKNESGDWISLGTADNSDHGGSGITANQTESFFDLADFGISQTSQIRIVDTTSYAAHAANGDGFDLNFVEALHDSTVCPLAVEE